jgi:predicted nucleotidyltransferase
MQNPDTFLRQVLVTNVADMSPTSPALHVRQALMPVIQRWGGQQVLSVAPSGSFAKGTAVRSSTDIDLFVSLSSTTSETLAQIYDTLFNALTAAGLQPKRQNVSIGMRLGAYDVDVVPARRQCSNGGDHSLYNNRTSTWLQTNVKQHIALVGNSGRTNEIRLMKIWRNRYGLDFPSFYLELIVIRALHGLSQRNLSTNVVTVLEFLRDQLPTARVVDPANTNNIISDTVTVREKGSIAAAARAALQSNWSVEFA